MHSYIHFPAVLKFKTSRFKPGILGPLVLANGKLLLERMEIKIIFCRIYACYKTNLSAFGKSENAI